MKSLEVLKEAISEIPKMTHKEQILAELDSLYDASFNVPAGFPIPVATQILVKECSQEEYKTEGGIIVPGSSQLQHAKIGIVYRIGESVTIPVKIGFMVAYDKNANYGLIHNNVPYVKIYEHDIHAIIPPKTYLMPHVPNTEEKRRKERIDFTKRSYKKAQTQIDKIQNGETEIKK